MEFFENLGEIFSRFAPLLARAAGLTFAIAGVSLPLAAALGAALGGALALFSPPRTPRAAGAMVTLPVRAVCFFLGAVPFALLAPLLHYSIAWARGEPLPPFLSGTLLLALSGGAKLAPAAREAIDGWRDRTARERAASIALPLLARAQQSAGEVALLHIIGVTGLSFTADVIRLQGYPIVESTLAASLPYLASTAAIAAAASAIARAANKSARQDRGGGGEGE